MLDMLLVHLDDQDAVIQDAIYAVIVAMMENLDDVFLDLMTKKAAGARMQHRSPKYVLPNAQCSTNAKLECKSQS